MTEYKSQIGDGKYAIQFETEDHYLYAKVQQACREAIDSACGLKLVKHGKSCDEEECELCKDKRMKQYAISSGLKYCPICKRKLVSEE